MSREIPADSPSLVVSYDIDDALTPGIMVEVDAELAEELGAFEETALSEAAAAEANKDLAELTRGG
jgi:type IV secretion system protein VirB1